MPATALADRPISSSELLSPFGLQVAPGGHPVIIDQDRAHYCNVHHSSMPVAVAGFALADPDLARARFPNVRLVDLVAKRPVMDMHEAMALAAVCGVMMPPRLAQWSAASSALRVSAFVEQLHHVIARYGMGPFFGRDPNRAACNEIDVRPRGVDWRTDEIDHAEMSRWRTAYKSLPPAGQMMVATVLWLYRGGPDTTWLSRMSRDWHAVDAIETLHAHDALRAWARLVALYPGW